MTTFTDLQTCDGFLDFEFLHILSHMIESVDLCHITFHQLLISYNNKWMILLSIITTEYGLQETISDNLAAYFSTLYRYPVSGLINLCYLPAEKL
mgnify:FL=1